VHCAHFAAFLLQCSISIATSGLTHAMLRGFENAAQSAALALYQQCGMLWCFIIFTNSRMQRLALRGQWLAVLNLFFVIL
jgi:hypothetical protein